MSNSDQMVALSAPERSARKPVSSARSPARFGLTTVRAMGFNLADHRRSTIAGALAVALIAVVSLAWDRTGMPSHSERITGPYARLLNESLDLGPAKAGSAQLTVALRQRSEPVRLTDWAHSHGLAVRWSDGQDWAVIHGAPEALADAFDILLHNYRIREGADTGRVFFASPQQPEIPLATRTEVAGLGRVLGYTPNREAMPPMPLPREVPDGGLRPRQLLTAYNATPLVDKGNTGKNQTVIVFGFDGFHQEDLDTFADFAQLPRFTPEVVGEMPDHVSGETNMDLQVVHAVAPDAKLVLVNAHLKNDGGGAFENLAALMNSVDEKFPGAIWSLSIGWGCDRIFTSSDLTPVRAALTRAIGHGTTAFDATGDLAGLECKGGRKWSEPPSPDDVGVDAVSSIPEMTTVGGTKLSTGRDGEWVAEHSWYNTALIQGTGGGASQLFERPDWQDVGVSTALPARRLLPDVSAVADPLTGVRIVLNQQVVIGGGTSQAAPIWAGLAALMNQALTSRGASPLGNLNPVLYKLSKSPASHAFHDISLGGNAIMPSSATGYDMVTGLGTPDVADLVREIAVTRAVS